MTPKELDDQAAHRNRRTAVLLTDIVVSVGLATTTYHLYGIGAAALALAISTGVFHLLGKRVGL